MARRRRAGAVLLALVLAALAWDLSREPSAQVSARVLLAGIDAYQATLSGRIPGAVCRFEPTCSLYAESSIRRHGALRGAGRALVRLARCGPWTPQGAHDPP